MVFSHMLQCHAVEKGRLKMNNTVQCSVWFFKRKHGHLTDADVARLVRAHKPLAVAIDTMVKGAAFTHCTTGT